MAVLRLLDVALVAGGFGAATWLHAQPWHAGMTAAAASAAALFLVLAEHRGLYRSWRGGGLRQEVREMAAVWIWALLGLLAAGFVTKTSAEFSRRVLLTWAAVTPVALAGLRFGLRGLARVLRLRGVNHRRAAIAGVGDTGARVARTVREAPWMGLDLVGAFDDPRPGAQPRMEQRGSLEDLVALARSGGVDVVYVALPLGASEHIERLVRELATTHVSVYFVPDLAPFALLRSRWFTLGAVPTVSLLETPLGGVSRFAKRTEDLVVASVCLAFAALPMLVIAVAIKLGSPGPVIFRQQRRGLDGRTIVVRKFRTMYAAACEQPFAQACRGDQRVTPLGRLLRATSLDELPQLLNVLAGDMSVVGPRPHPVPLDEAHRDRIDWYVLRHRVKPGITGLAQIHGFRGETDRPEKMQGRIERDLEYVQNWSLWLDLKILALTVLRGFVGTSAY